MVNWKRTKAFLKPTFCLPLKRFPFKILNILNEERVNAEYPPAMKPMRTARKNRREMRNFQQSSFEET